MEPVFNALRLNSRGRIAPRITFALTEKSHYLVIAVATKVNQLRDYIGEEARENC
jgi:hypothetical protein